MRWIAWMKACLNGGQGRTLTFASLVSFSSYPKHVVVFSSQRSRQLHENLSPLDQLTKLPFKATKVIRLFFFVTCLCLCVCVCVSSTLRFIGSLVAPPTTPPSSYFMNDNAKDALLLRQISVRPFSTPCKFPIENWHTHKQTHKLTTLPLSSKQFTISNRQVHGPLPSLPFYLSTAISTLIFSFFGRSVYFLPLMTLLESSEKKRKGRSGVDLPFTYSRLFVCTLHLFWHQ